MGITLPVTSSDLTALSADDLSGLAASIFEEQQRRYRVDMAPAKLDQALKDYQDASGTTKTDGADWAQPDGALDAYPMGAVVAHNGRRYESLIPANVWEPGAASDPQNYRWWKDLDAGGSTSSGPVVGPAAWDGSGKSYSVGDLVSYEGNVYEVVQAHTSQLSWTPDLVQSLYTLKSN